MSDCLFAAHLSFLRAFPEDKQQDILQEIQDRLTNIMFVELLFEKGSREADMILQEYSWHKAVQAKMSDLGIRDNDNSEGACPSECNPAKWNTA
jgi:hypothetical protein